MDVDLSDARDYQRSCQMETTHHPTFCLEQGISPSKLIHKVSHGRNFRGTGGMADRFGYM